MNLFGYTFYAPEADSPEGSIPETAANTWDDMRVFDVEELKEKLASVVSSSEKADAQPAKQEAETPTPAVASEPETEDSPAAEPEQPEEEQPETEQPEAEQAEAEQPEAEQPETEQAEEEQSEAEQAEEEQSEAEPLPEDPAEKLAAGLKLITADSEPLTSVSYESVAKAMETVKKEPTGRFNRDAIDDEALLSELYALIGGPSKPKTDTPESVKPKPVQKPVARITPETLQALPEEPEELPEEDAVGVPGWLKGVFILLISLLLSAMTFYAVASDVIGQIF